MNRLFDWYWNLRPAHCLALAGLCYLVVGAVEKL
jgi:hypothetical protein